ncbi:unnamed protein product [Rotaria sordida]|uniref:Uncharacterized protein n=3 Tax=Rotaria sordida TaxID=392033 RepID=A0A815EX63_9BILA|nr:unnamed protein product [Rotaria sordida]
MIDHLSSSIEQLKLKSKSILSHWQEYNRVLLQIEKIIREPEAGIDRLQTINRLQAEHLQIIELHRHDLDQILSQGRRQLSSQCDGETSLKINEIRHRIQQQWTNVEQRRQFNSSYVHLLDRRLDELEGRWYRIQREIFTSDIESLFDKTNDFQQRLQQLDNEITRLYERAQKLGNHLPPIVPKKINTQYSVIKNQYLELCTHFMINFKLLIRYNELDHALDDVSISIKSIRTLQQQPTDELNQFILQCQSKDRKLTQHRHELQRLRQTITEISPELHPDDINQLMQKLNVLEIQWSDAERIIRTLIDNLTKKRSEYHDFENKCKRLIEWFEHFLNTEINHRIDGLTLEASLDILKTEIRNLISDKRRSVNDLIIAARVLQRHITDQLQLQTLKQQIDRLEQILNRTEEHDEKRIKKTEIVLKMFHDFEQGLENLRSWMMDTIETNLQKSLSINTLNANQLRDHQQSIIAIETDIEKYTTIVSSVLALGHYLLSEIDIRSRNINSIPRTIQ